MTEQKIIDITDMTDNQLAELLGVTEETEKVRCNVTFMNGYYYVSVGLKYSELKHKRHFKDHIDVMKKMLPTIGYTFKKCIGTELTWKGNRRGFENDYIIEVVKN